MVKDVIFLGGSIMYTRYSIKRIKVFVGASFRDEDADILLRKVFDDLFDIMDSDRVDISEGFIEHQKCGVGR